MDKLREAKVMNELGDPKQWNNVLNMYTFMFMLEGEF